MHVIFINVHKFLTVDFLDGKYFSELAESNFSDPFAYFFDCPFGDIVDFSFKSDEKIITRGKFDDGFGDEVMEEFGFEDFVLVEILVGVDLVWSLLLKVADKGLVMIIEEIGFTITDNNLNDILVFIELDKVVFQRYVVQKDQARFLIYLWLVIIAKGFVFYFFQINFIVVNVLQELLVTQITVFGFEYCVVERGLNLIYWYETGPLELMFFLEYFVRILLSEDLVELTVFSEISQMLAFALDLCYLRPFLVV